MHEHVAGGAAPFALDSYGAAAPLAGLHVSAAGLVEALGGLACIALGVSGIGLALAWWIDTTATSRP